MDRARVAVLLISSDFLTSKFIRGTEVPRLLERRAEEGLLVVPLIVRPCAWREVPWLSRFQFWPRDGRALESGGGQQVDQNLSDLAEEIARLVGPRTLHAVTTSTSEPRVEIARLPVTSPTFVGRENELARLDAAWADTETCVLSCVAFGGVVSRLWSTLGSTVSLTTGGAAPNASWSFFSQGTDTTGASGDSFADHALGWFGYQGEELSSPWERGAALASLVRKQRTLLVLDGLEPLQHPPGQLTGRLKDPVLQALVRGLAVQNPGLCVITTRVEVADVSGRSGVEQVDLDRLSPEAGASLLGRLGVTGPSAELEAASEEFGGHGLALTLLGTYLRDVCAGDVRRRREVPFLDDDKHGGHARRLMASYESWLETDDLQVLQMACTWRFDEVRPIASLELKNYRLPGHRILKLSNAKFHLVHGRNGCGKSTIAEAFELALTGRIELLGDPEKVDYQKIVGYCAPRNEDSVDEDSIDKSPAEIIVHSTSSWLSLHPLVGPTTTFRSPTISIGCGSFRTAEYDQDGSGKSLNYLTSRRLGS